MKKNMPLQEKISSKQILLIVALSGFVIIAAFFWYFTTKNAAQDDSALSAENVAVLPGQEQVNVELPVRFKIPSINVDAPVEYVGLTSDGAMDIPKGPNEVAWFNLGPRPGENGSAVVAGHFGWKDNIPAVFDDLHKLRIGDKISVEDESGEVITFVVRKVREYDKDDIVPEVFGQNDGKAHLNLITCMGDWNKGEEAYSKRLVVFTDKEH